MLAELCLIFFLGTDQLVWWMRLILMALYAVYFALLMRSMGMEQEEDFEEIFDEDADEVSSIFKALLTFDFNHRLFQCRSFSPERTLKILGCATSTIAVACYLLSESVMLSAEALDVQPYLTTVILGGEVTSVPDECCLTRMSSKGAINPVG